jgi:ADP-ribose pyrophosphatase YjhB (NUDIX family)
VLNARFCLRCGHRLATARVDGHARRKCPACGWIHYVNPVPAAVALIERRGKLLLTRRARPPYAGTWDLPGGFLEADETPEAGLRRELEEELGVRVQRWRLVGVATDRYGRGGFPVLTLIYQVTVRGALRPADDVSEARWVPRSQLPLEEVGFPSMRRLFRALARGRRRGALRLASGR